MKAARRNLRIVPWPLLMAARPRVIDEGQFASSPAARRKVPARALVGTVRLIPQNLFYQFAFADDRPLLHAPTLDIDCSSSILGSDIEVSRNRQMLHVFFKLPKRRRS